MGWVLLTIAFVIMGFTPKTHDLVILVQDYRAEYKAPPLIEDPRLECAAKLHLAYIISKRSCVSVTATGKTIWDEVRYCGFKPEEIDLVLLCQVLTLESWFERLYMYRIEARTLRDFRWKYIGVAGDQLWFTMILAR